MLKKVKLPYGFQDFMPDECYNKDLLERRLAEKYRSYGYYKVETPTMEYYDTFHDVYRPDKLKKVFKLTDNDGSLLALRPDITLQISRMASGLDQKYPKRLFYSESSFEYQDSRDTARTREFAQTGVELLGNTGIDGEIEIITLAIESFICAGLERFTIEIGNNSFFKGLIKESGLNDEETSVLTELINKKDSLGLEIFLQRKEVPKSVSECILSLPSLFGTKEVLKHAEKLIDNEMSLSALNHTYKLFESLEKIGYDRYVSLDLGLLHGLNYYSGLVIKGYSADFGLCLLDGGRYDGICPSFGYDSGAVGFAIGTKRLLSALDELGKLKTAPSCDVAYISDGSDNILEKDYVDSLRNANLSVVKLFTTSKDRLKQYCRDSGVKRAFAVFKGKIDKVIVGEANES